MGSVAIPAGFRGCWWACMPRLEWAAFMASQAEGAAEVEGGASEVAKPKRKTERVSKARLRVCVCVCALGL